DRISSATVRRILLNKGDNFRKPYAPRSVPIEMHPRVKKIVDDLYEEESTRTTTEIIETIKEKLGLAVYDTNQFQVKKEVVAIIRQELGLRQYRVRYGHAVRLINQLIRLVYCEKMLEKVGQFLTHTFTDESYIQVGKNSQTCFVKNRFQARKAAPKHAAKLLIWGGISVRGPCPLKVLRGKEVNVDSPKYQQILHEKYLQWSRFDFY
ncbi:hypothetical protein PFISCL1PPCAC_17048, partial [Pristionchus fissidentatus]